MSAQIIPSGITPQPPLDGEIRAAIETLCGLLGQSALDALARIRQAEAAGIARLNEYVPTERLLDLKEAAAYLKFTPRSVDEWTRGDRPLLQFRMIGGQKRFRKAWLDAAIDNGSVKPREVKLS